MTTNILSLSYLTIVSLEWEIIRTEIAEKFKIYFRFNNIFCLISFRLRDNVEKCCREGQTTDDNTLRAMRMRIKFKKTHTQNM